MRDVPEKLRPRDYEPLRRLAKAGVARKTDVRGKHEPRSGHPGGPRLDVYYLEKSGGDALLQGAFAAGVEDDLVARGNWRLHQLPARAEHAYFRTETILRVKEDLEAENARRAALPMHEQVRLGQAGPYGALDRDSIYGESCPEYPIRGIYTGTASNPPVPRRGWRGFQWFVPDGRFEVAWPAVGRCAYDLEIEYRSRPKQVFEKVEKRAGWLRRLLDEREGGRVARRERALRAAERLEEEKRPPGFEKLPDTKREMRQWRERTRLALPFVGFPEEVCPVLFVYPTRQGALGMRDRITDAVADGGLPRFRALDRELRRRKRLPGWMFLFVGWDELRPRVVEREAFEGGEAVIVEEPEDHGHSLERVYAPLSDYSPGDGGGDGVDLKTAAIYRKNFVRADEPKAPPRGGGGGR